MNAIYTYEQFVSFILFTLIIGFCFGDIFQVIIRKWKAKTWKEHFKKIHYVTKIKYTKWKL